MNGQLSSPNEWLTPKESHPKSKIVYVKFDSMGMERFKVKNIATDIDKRYRTSRK